MTKHVSDQPRSNDGARLREYTRQERESGIHPSVAALHSRAKNRDDDGRKAKEYARIERGQTV